MAWSGQFPEAEVKKGSTFELDNLPTCDAFDENP